MSNEKDEKFGMNHGHDHDCDCGHDHDHDHQHTIKLEFDDGEEVECPILDIFEVEGNEYIALLHPVEETALLYHFIDHEDGTIELTSIDDDDEYEAVSSAFMSMLDEDDEE